MVEEGKGSRGVKFVVMGELTDDVLHNCTLETCIILLTSATLISSIKTVVPRALGHAGWSYISQRSCNITVIL